MFRKLDDSISVAGQIGPADLAEARRQGFVHVVNNRPDGEQPGQPGDAGITPDQVEAMGAALAAANGPVLAYCRSGTRSTYVWALARAAAGDAPDVLTAKAAGAGYDIAGLWR